MTYAKTPAQQALRLFPGDGKWRVSKKRLRAIETRLEEIDAEASALDIGTEAPRFANAAHRDRWNDLDREWKWLYNEAEIVRMGLWRRQRRGSWLH